MCVADYFSIVKDIALAIAAAVTAYVAYTGLGKWQKELNGKASFDVARQLAKCTYELRDSIRYCRSPFTAAHEFPEEYKAGTFETPSKDDNGKAWAYVYEKRWKPVREALQSFDVVALEAEALWGTEVSGKVLEMRKCVRELQVYIDAYITNQYSGGDDFEDKTFRNEVELGIRDIKPDENSTSQKIKKAIEDIESVIRPHLTRPV